MDNVSSNAAIHFIVINRQYMNLKKMEMYFPVRL